MQNLINKLNARDPLFMHAEAVANEVHTSVLQAFRNGDTDSAEGALLRHGNHVRELVENLRIYQAELHAQADELAASQARTEQALRDFAALFSHMPVAVLRVAMNGEVVDYNSRARDLFGLRPSAARARFLHRLVSATDYQTVVRPALHEARATGWSVIEAVTLQTEGARPFDGEMHIAAVATFSSEAPQFACAVLDRTEQRSSVRALQDAVETSRRSEAFLADSARLAHIGGWEFNVDTRRLRWSREMIELFGLSATQAPGGLAALKLCGPDARRRLHQGLMAAIERGQAFDLEVDVLSPQGRPMRVLVFGHAEFDGAFCKRVSGVCQDITSQHRAREQIGDLTARLKMAHEAGGIGVWDWDLDGPQLYLNERSATLLGLAVEDHGHTSLRTALQARLLPEDAERFDAAVDRALHQHEPLDIELFLHESGRPTRCLHLTGRAQGGRHGLKRRLIGCARDCTAQKEASRLMAAKEAAEFASRAKSAFLSRMSHELRTPLNAILGFSQLMRLEAAAGDLVAKPHRAFFIETAARHLLDLINEVLDVSRIESGQLMLSMGPVDLRQIVEECLPLVIGQADSQDVQVLNTIDADAGLRVHCDRLRLKEVVINLLSNAVKYNRRGGQVLIDAEALADGQIALDIADTGHGLDADQRAALFQPFNRLGAEATGIEGSGMGLFVSKRFIELMGGTIEVASERGVGTRVTVRLAAAA